MSNFSVTVTSVNQINVTVTPANAPAIIQVAQQGPEGIQGPRGLTEYSGNIDGGYPNSVYTGIPIVDGGDV